MKPVVVIPAYEPDNRLVSLVEEISKNPTVQIIIVNDGSGPKFNDLFRQVREISNRVHVLEHAVNLGKGVALKTAFNHFLLTFPSTSPGVVTADADGQHLPTDILRFVDALSQSSSALIIGVRSFDDSVPFKSRFGNVMTRFLFLIFFHRALKDTQTGLRAIPREFIEPALKIRGSGYEYEFEMLIHAINSGFPLEEEGIVTVYLDGNKKTHFNPLFDSIRIYFVFVRFSTVSIFTGIIDSVIFFLSYLLTGKIFLSSFISRIFSGAFNFTIGKKFVFKSSGDTRGEILRYSALAIALMFISYGLVTSLVIFAGFPVLVAKILSEACLFVSNFAVQRVFVFTSRKNSFQRPVKPTDWDAYYAKPSKTASITRKITEKLLLRLIQTYSNGGKIEHICELGGANSCFYEALRKVYPRVRYTVVDNNKKGLELFRHAHERENSAALEGNVLALEKGLIEADIVFSVGLIEHFSPRETATAIISHFKCSRPGQLVIITFPTPTFLYRATRSIIEKLGLWIFHDERPLTMDEVIASIKPHAKILYTGINWKIFLTQGIVVAQTSETDVWPSGLI